MPTLSGPCFALKSHSARHDVQHGLGLAAPAGVPFATKYAPRSLPEFFGNEASLAKMLRLAENPSPCAVLFCGPTGTGKTTLATAFARAIGVNVEDTWGRGGWHEVPPGLATKEAVIECLKELRFHPIHGSGWRVVVVNEADYMHETVLNFWLGIIDNGESIRREYGKTVFVFTTESLAKMTKKRQAFVDRCNVVELSADPAELRDAAQSYADAIFQAELGWDAPTLDPELEGLLDPHGNLSMRRVASWCEGIIRDGRAPSTPQRPAIEADSIPPISGGSPVADAPAMLPPPPAEILVPPPSVLSKASDMDAWLNRISDECYRDATRAEYREPASQETRNRGIALILSSWTQWAGEDLMDIAWQALEDANFHGQARAIKRMLDAFQAEYDDAEPEPIDFSSTSVFAIQAQPTPPDMFFFLVSRGTSPFVEPGRSSDVSDVNPPALIADHASATDTGPSAEIEPDPTPPSPDFPTDEPSEPETPATPPSTSFSIRCVNPKGVAQSYQATPLPIGLDGLRAYRVERSGSGSDYDVSETASGRAVCSCPDFRSKHADLPYSAGCKHVKALVALGLLANGVPTETDLEKTIALGLYAPVSEIVPTGPGNHYFVVPAESEPDQSLGWEPEDYVAPDVPMVDVTVWGVRQAVETLPNGQRFVKSYPLSFYMADDAEPETSDPAPEESTAEPEQEVKSATPPPAVSRGVPADAVKIQVHAGCRKGFYRRKPGTPDWQSVRSGNVAYGATVDAAYERGDVDVIERTPIQVEAQAEPRADDDKILAEVFAEVEAIGKLFADAKAAYARLSAKMGRDVASPAGVFEEVLSS